MSATQSSRIKSQWHTDGNGQTLAAQLLQLSHPSTTTSLKATRTPSTTRTMMRTPSSRSHTWSTILTKRTTEETDSTDITKWWIIEAKRFSIETFAPELSEATCIIILKPNSEDCLPLALYFFLKINYNLSFSKLSVNLSTIKAATKIYCLSMKYVGQSIPWLRRWRGMQ